MKRRFVVAGIHTDVGKTFVAGVLCRGLNYHYWKPVQTGTDQGMDREWITSVAGVPSENIVSEQYRFRIPASPHLAAQAENVQIQAEHITLPTVENGLIIELAGGLMVPLNDDVLMIDLLQEWQLPVILVIPLYLGSINHALLSLEALQHRRIPIGGIIFNHGDQPNGAPIIAARSRAPVIGHLPLIPPNEALIRNAFNQYLKDGWLLAGLPCDAPAVS